MVPKIFRFLYLSKISWTIAIKTKAAQKNVKTIKTIHVLFMHFEMTRVQQNSNFFLPKRTTYVRLLWTYIQLETRRTTKAQNLLYFAKGSFYS